jgi:3-oxoacyl-[acyl-carrier protein] reductase
MDLELTDKTALIIGGSRGIGRAIAAALAREGARVALVARGEEALRATVAALRAAGAEAHAVVGDVATEAGAQAAVGQAIETLGSVDVLVNNAGGSLGSGTFEKATAAQWREVLDLNLMAAVWCSQAVVGWMHEHGGGAIVNVSSICGREYCATAPYMAAKAAMIAMTKEMSVSLARHHIRVNSVAPGSVMFPGGSWDRRAKDDPGRIEKMKRDELPMGRFGTPEEVADVVAFLCSARASWMTGACVPVDGAQGRAL